MPLESSFSTRSSEFDQLIRNSVFTRRNGETLSLQHGVQEVLDLLQRAKEADASVYVVGNGGSAAVAGHIVTDFCNVCGIRATTLHDAAILTCFSNDYGYENAFAVQLEKMARKGDLLIAISSSGQSRNILNAALAMRKRCGYVITLSGFLSNNPLRLTGDFNYWVNSKDYGMVEIAHLFALHHWSDCLGAKWSNAEQTIPQAAGPTLSVAGQ